MIAICNILTRPSQQYEFCNYPLNEYCQRDSIGQSDPGGPGGPGGQGGQGGPGGPGGPSGQGGPGGPGFPGGLGC